MQWNQMTRSQQNAARRMSEKLFAEGFKGCTVSQCAKYYDEAERYQDGGLSADQLAKATGWFAPGETDADEEPAETVTKNEAPEQDSLAALDSAVAARVSADEALTAAMHAARKDGHSANTIARRVAPVHSRPTALGMLNEADLRTRATAALLDAGFRVDDVRFRTGPGRMVLVQLIAEDADGSGTAMNTASAVLNALRDAGLSTSVRNGDPFERLEHMASGGEMAITTGE